ncbi:stonustoxin subunit beta-like, partial [Hypomesus transpacificus]|uniref:stonustoxin subunit beta-like n=1 Tax=Hypomesus transpacificus TaxID=137520 RepID=UPI001F0801AE
VDACDLTLDPNTAHRKLIMSEDNRRVEVKPWPYCNEFFGEEHPYPDHPERFDLEQQVLCTEGLTGRHYWEVEGQVLVGVTYRSIRRRGMCDACTLGDNNRSWGLSRSRFTFGFCQRLSVHHNCEQTLIHYKLPSPSRVGVYLDWPAGVLSFYSISSDTMTHLHTFITTFSEPLYPAFGLRTVVITLGDSSPSSMYLCVCVGEKNITHTSDQRTC